MSPLTRRGFLGAAAGLAAGCTRATSDASPGARLDRIGLGLFTIPTMLERDFAGAMKTIAGIGYREVELFGPYPFSAPSAQERWKTVSQSLAFRGSGYFGLEPAAVRAILDEHGVTSPSMHTDLESLRTTLPAMAEAAETLGQRYVVLPSIPQAERQSLDGYRRVADELNEIGRRAAALGLRFAYHNHGYGLVPVDGQVPFDLVVERTDPAFVDLQMDLYWTTAGGADPVAYFTRYPGRFRLIHIKDMSQPVRFSGDGGDPAQWIELFPYIADAGAGVLDLRAILSAAKKAGVEHFLVERDQAPSPEETLRSSYQYLSSLVLPA